PPAIFSLSLHDALPIFNGVVADNDVLHPVVRVVRLKVNDGRAGAAGLTGVNEAVVLKRYVAPVDEREVLRGDVCEEAVRDTGVLDRKSTRLNSSHSQIS